MLVDLEEVEAQSEPIRSQVCIIGAGLAGLLLAQRLAAAGIGVALLEAGGRTLEDRSQRIYEARMARLKHDGTCEGRFRLLGGTSTRWGGQLMPYTAEILQPPTFLAVVRLAADDRRGGAVLSRRRASSGCGYPPL